MNEQWEEALMYAIGKIIKNHNAPWIGENGGTVMQINQEQLSPITTFILEMARDKASHASIRYITPIQAKEIGIPIAKGEKGNCVASPNGKKEILYNLNQLAGMQQKTENKKVMQICEEHQQNLKSKIINYFLDRTEGKFNQEIISTGENNAISKRLYEWIINDAGELPKEIKEPLAEVGAGLIAYKCGLLGKVINKDTLIKLYDKDISYRKKVIRVLGDNINKIYNRFIETIKNHVHNVSNNEEIIKAIAVKLKQAAERTPIKQKELMSISINEALKNSREKKEAITARIEMPNEKERFKPTKIWININGRDIGPKYLSTIDANRYAQLDEHTQEIAKITLAQKMFKEELKSINMSGESEKNIKGLKI